MKFKTVIAPLTFAFFAFLLAYTQPDLPCLLTFVAKVATNISL
jgi:hypothetical protein